jgi:hypothetical protein
MTGFRYDRQRWDRDVYAGDGEEWVVGGRSLQVVDHAREPDRLELSVRLRSAGAREALNELKDDAGSYETWTRADGVAEARDTVGGSNTVTVSPPTRFSPPRVAGPYLVDSVTATRTSADGTAERASVVLVPEASRGLGDTAALSATTGGWRLAFEEGIIDTDRVASDIRNDGDRVELRLTVTPRQADVIEASVSAVGGVVSERLPDDDTRVRDVTPDERQTVTLTPPSASPVDAGDYAVLSWRTESVTSARHQTTITLDAV